MSCCVCSAKVRMADMPVCVRRRFAAAEGYTDEIDMKDMARFEAELIETVRREIPELYAEIHSGKKLAAERLTQLRGVIEEFKKTF